MCGIAGIMRFDDKPISKEAIEMILQQLSHRGRDHQGIVAIQPNLVLGHRRLSIIDLNHKAHQPMFYGKHLCITYNGEIYNYRELRKYLEDHQYHFKTQSDTEVILAAYDHWQEELVHHLNGMFAFALWDDEKRRLFCARDPLGIKPFYYLLTPTFFAFASESKALAHLCDRRLNRQAVYEYLLCMYVPTKASFFADIQKLLPAHTLSVTAKTHHEKRYWQISEFEIDEQQKGEDARPSLEAIHEKLKVAVKRQLRSDVPIGGFLSGGIDSGLITALAREHCHQYHTYSIGYEGTATLNNELPYAKRLAHRYGTKHTEVYLTAQSVMPYINNAIRHFSEPIADPALLGTYVLAQYAAKDGVKVLLNGTGGDEIFAGYTRYTGQLSRLRQLFIACPQELKKIIAYLPFTLKTKMRMKNLSLDMLLSAGGSYQLFAQMIHHKKHLQPTLLQMIENLLMPHYTNRHTLYQRMLVDMHTYLPHELLFLLDQMTMAHTLEGRVPLLDKEIVESAFQFKAKQHIKGGQTKTLLKTIASGYLGEQHVRRQKQGFAGSTEYWVKQNFNDFVDGIADVQSIAGCEHFNIDHYTNFEMLTPKRANDLFILYCLNTWYKTWMKPYSPSRLV